MSHATLPQLLLNVPALADKPPEEVERVLGRPERTRGGVVHHHPRNVYKRGTVEVVYIDGRAGWIKLYHTRGMTFGEESLPKLGLPSRKPTYVNRDHVISWSNICNLKEVSFYADHNGGVSSVLICVRTNG